MICRAAGFNKQEGVSENPAVILCGRGSPQRGYSVEKRPATTPTSDHAGNSRLVSEGNRIEQP